MIVDQLVNKDLNQVDLKRRHSGNGSSYGRGSSAKSNVTCCKCEKNGHIQKDCG